MPSLGRTVSLNAVDKALLALESRNERIVFHMTLTVLGQIDPAKLSQAILLTMRAHPTMRSVLRVRRFRYFREERDGSDREVLTIRDTIGPRDGNGSTSKDHDGALLDWMNRPMDLREVPPVRVLLLRRRRHDCLVVFTFHHSAADGLRALRFIREVIGNYNEEGTSNPLPEEDTCSCHRRDEVLSMTEKSRARAKHFYLKLLRNLFDRFVIGPLSPPTRLFHDKCDRPSGEISSLSRTIYPSQLTRISSMAKASGATLNDLLLASCFRTVEEWNRMHGRRSHKISIMVPVDVGRGSSSNVISNQVSYISPFTNCKDRANATALLRSTARARANLIRNGNHVSMVYFTYLISFLPLPAIRAVARILLLTQIHVDSILLTNLGSIWPRADIEGGQTRLGPALVSEVSAIAPVITPFRMSLLASMYNGALNITLSYKTCLISQEKARAFLDLFVEELLSDDTIKGSTTGALTASPGGQRREMVG